MTRTSCTHLYFIKRKCESYNCVPSGKRFCGATVSTAVTPSGHEVESLPYQLEGDYNRQMGSGCSEWFSDTIHQPARSKRLAKPSYILHRAKLTNRGGGEHTTREGCCYSDRQPSATGELLFNPVYSPQERGSNEASHQPQKPQ